MSEIPGNPVFDIAMAYQKTAALVAAVKLDLFTVIGSAAMTCDDLASRTGASARGLRMLCDFLTVLELLKKDNASYSLSHSAKVLLDRTSPFAMGGIVDFVAAPETIQLFLEDPVSYVRRGGASGLSNLAPDHPIWVRFAKAMTPIAAGTAKRVASFVANRKELPRSVLDIAAGHGLYGIEIAKISPSARVTAVDWPSVLTIASAHAEAAGVAQRFCVLPGNALELAWGRDFDLILLPNFLHHFDADTCTSLLRKVKASLATDGIAIAVDFVPNENRTSPPVPAMFAFWMLASTPGGDAYTAGEFDKMARSAGFRAVTVRSLLPTPESLIVFEN